METSLRGSKMELKIEWRKVEDVKLLHGRLYFIANISKYGITQKFSMGHRVQNGWQSNEGITEPFEVTHASLIHRVTHKILPTSYAIGDKVEIIKTECDYKQYSVGEIVGKYDLGQTWCVRMEDNFVILIKNEDFRLHFTGGENV